MRQRFEAENPKMADVIAQLQEAVAQLDHKMEAIDIEGAAIASKLYLHE